jgi:hypothetical protein
MSAMNEPGSYSSEQDYLQVPLAMRQGKRWLLHKYKIPHYANGIVRNGELDGDVDKSNLVTFDQALVALQNGGYSGLGFALGEGWQGIDLDKVEENGLQALANSLPGYVEYSPSALGCHAIGYGGSFPALKLKGIEAYSGARYFTVTGNAIGGELCDLAPFVATHLEPLRPRPATATPLEAPSAPTQGDADIVGKLLANPRHAALYGGDLSAYSGDHSRADLDLCNVLALLGCTPEQAERIWLTSPLGQRDKTQCRTDYRRFTLKTAFATKPPPVPAVNLNGITANGAPLQIGVIALPASPWVSAGDLRHKHFEPTEWVVPGIIPQGAIILGGRPKLGKSWAALETGIAVAEAGVVFAKQCEAGDVLYAALEDTERRLKSRMWKLKGEAPWPKRLNFICELPRADEGGVELVRKWIEQADNPRLVIIDTLAKVRPGKGRDEGSYDADYRAVTVWKALADEYNIAVVLVHHVRKLIAEDPLEMISGTNGLTGAADAIIILNRTSQGCTLGGRGRDLEEFEHAISFNPEACRWTVLGNAADIQRSSERNAILGLLRRSTEPLSPKQISHSLDMNDDAIRKMLLRMVEAGELIRTGRGAYATPCHNSHSATAAPMSIPCHNSHDGSLL